VIYTPRGTGTAPFSIQLRPVLPIPPEEQFRVVTLFCGVIDGATEDVEHATVHVTTLNRTLPPIELHGVATDQVRHPLDSQTTKIGADARAYTWDLLKGVSTSHPGVLHVRRMRVE